MSEVAVAWFPSWVQIAVALAVPVALALLVWAVIGIHKLRRPEDDDERRDMLEDLRELTSWLNNFF